MPAKFDLQINKIQKSWFFGILKFTYSEKATKFCQISTLLLSYVVPVKSKVEIPQNIVAFSEYLNFITVSKVFLKKKISPKDS